MSRLLLHTSLSTLMSLIAFNATAAPEEQALIDAIASLSIERAPESSSMRAHEFEKNYAKAVKQGRDAYKKVLNEYLPQEGVAVKLKSEMDGSKDKISPNFTLDRAENELDKFVKLDLREQLTRADFNPASADLTPEALAKKWSESFSYLNTLASLAKQPNKDLFSTAEKGLKRWLPEEQVVLDSQNQEYNSPLVKFLFNAYGKNVEHQLQKIKVITQNDDSTPEQAMLDAVLNEWGYYATPQGAKKGWPNFNTKEGMYQFLNGNAFIFFSLVEKPPENDMEAQQAALKNPKIKDEFKKEEFKELTDVFIDISKKLLPVVSSKKDENYQKTEAAKIMLEYGRKATDALFKLAGVSFDEGEQSFWHYFHEKFNENTLMEFAALSQEVQLGNPLTENNIRVIEHKVSRNPQKYPTLNMVKAHYNKLKSDLNRPGNKDQFVEYGIYGMSIQHFDIFMTFMENKGVKVNRELIDPIITAAKKEHESGSSSAPQSQPGQPPQDDTDGHFNQGTLKEEETGYTQTSFDPFSMDQAVLDSDSLTEQQLSLFNEKKQEIEKILPEESYQKLKSIAILDTFYTGGTEEASMARLKQDYETLFKAMDEYATSQKGKQRLDAIQSKFAETFKDTNDFSIDWRNVKLLDSASKEDPLKKAAALEKMQAFYTFLEEQPITLNIYNQDVTLAPKAIVELIEFKNNQAGLKAPFSFLSDGSEKVFKEVFIPQKIKEDDINEWADVCKRASKIVRETTDEDEIVKKLLARELQSFFYKKDSDIDVKAESLKKLIKNTPQLDFEDYSWFTKDAIKKILGVTNLDNALPKNLKAFQQALGERTFIYGPKRRFDLEIALLENHVSLPDALFTPVLIKQANFKENKVNNFSWGHPTTIINTLNNMSQWKGENDENVQNAIRLLAGNILNELRAEETGDVLKFKVGVDSDFKGGVDPDKDKTLAKLYNELIKHYSIKDEEIPENAKSTHSTPPTHFKEIEISE